MRAYSIYFRNSIYKDPAEISSAGFLFFYLFDVKNGLFSLIFKVIKVGIVVDYTIC